MDHVIILRIEPRQLSVLQQRATLDAIRAKPLPDYIHRLFQHFLLRCIPIKQIQLNGTIRRQQIRAAYADAACGSAGPNDNSA